MLYPEMIYNPANGEVIKKSPLFQIYHHNSISTHSCPNHTLRKKTLLLLAHEFVTTHSEVVQVTHMLHHKKITVNSNPVLNDVSQAFTP